jgi:RNA polymerase sigma-54 factor
MPAGLAPSARWRWPSSANHLEHLAARDFARIKKALACDDDELREAQTLIRSLNPRPGAQFAPIDTRYVVPDVSQ